MLCVTSVLFFFVGLFIFLIGSSIVFLWVGIEVISLSIVLWIVSGTHVCEANGSVLLNRTRSLFKYFFIQLLAGVVVLWGISYASCDYLVMFFIIMSIFVNLGVFPGLAWVVEIYSVLSFSQIFLISFIPKFVPIFFLYFFSCQEHEFFLLVYVVSVFTTVFAVAQSYNTTDLRHLVALSAIINTCWLSIAAWFEIWLFFFSLLVYVMLTCVVYGILNSSSYYSLTVSGNSSMKSEMGDLLFIVLIFVLGSFPFGVVFLYKFCMLFHFYVYSFPVFIFYVFILFNYSFILVYLRIAYYFSNHYSLECVSLLNKYNLSFVNSYFFLLSNILLWLFIFV